MHDCVAAHESAQRYTPPEIFEALDLTFDLDPCSPGPGKSYVPALTHYTIDDDGLTQTWAGTTWVHPPHDNAAEWVAKLAEHGDGIALVHASVTVDGPFLQGADMVCEVTEPVRFFHGSIAARGDVTAGTTILLAYGPKAAAALAASGLGTCTTPSTGAGTQR